MGSGWQGEIKEPDLGGHDGRYGGVDESASARQAK